MVYSTTPMKPGAPKGGRFHCALQLFAVRPGAPGWCDRLPNIRTRRAGLRFLCHVGPDRGPGRWQYAASLRRTRVAILHFGRSGGGPINHVREKL